MCKIGQLFRKHLEAHQTLKLPRTPVLSKRTPATGLETSPSLGCQQKMGHIHAHSYMGENEDKIKKTELDWSDAVASHETTPKLGVFEPTQSSRHKQLFGSS